MSSGNKVSLCAFILLLVVSPAVAADPLPHSGPDALPLNTAIEAAVLLNTEAVRSTSTLELSEGEHLSLGDCLKYAYAHNFDLKVARQELRKGRGERLEERSTALPKLLAGGEYDRRDKNSLAAFDGRTFGTAENWNSQLELQQPVFLGGEGVGRWQKGKLVERAAQAGYEVVVNSVTFEVKESFYDALLARANVAVQQQSVELLEEQLSLARNRFVAGVIPRFNVLRAEVELANARAPLIKARNDLRLALERLGLVLGMIDRDPAKQQPAVMISGALNYQAPGYELLSAIKTALKQRPELRQLQLIYQAEREGIDIERANYYPHLLAFAGYGWESSRFSDDLSDIDQGWRLGVRAEWNLFDGLRTQGKVVQAHASAESARVRLRERKKIVTVEVRRALSDLLEAEQLVKASRKVVEQAEEGLRQATVRLDSGAGQQIDVLDTRVALTEARTNEIVALHSFNVAVARSDQATGSYPR